MSESKDLRYLKSICTPDYYSDDLVIVDDARTLILEHSDDKFDDVILLLFVRTGQMDVEINGEPHKVSNRHLLICRPGLSISNPHYSDDFSGHALILTMRYGQSIISVAGNIWNYLVSIDSQPVIPIPDTVRSIMLEYYRLLKLEVAHTSNTYYCDVINSLVRAMIYSLISDTRRVIQLSTGGDLANAYETRYNGSKQAMVLFHGFIDILINEHCKQRKIDYYAQRLCVTPKYLSTVCRQISNRTAHEWICDAVVNAIEQKLRYSEQSIKEISIEYGFTTLSFFSKFVKDHLGKSPSELRKNS